jgi:hypothetical protein
MLASLLPGLRDVRTPLVVGYLWLIFAWLMWGDLIPEQRPAGDGAIARLFDLSDFLGSTALIASISFVAYVLGAVLTIPLEGRLAERARDWFGTGSRENVSLDQNYVAFIREIENDFPDVEIELRGSVVRGAVGRMGSEAEHRRTLTDPSPDQLRPRLLASDKTEVYGEYDRLAAEAAFRMNLFPPLIALSLYGAVTIDWRYLLGIVVAVVLSIQGLNRLEQSRRTLTRAAIDGVFKHPLREYLENARSRQSRQGPDLDVEDREQRGSGFSS